MKDKTIGFLKEVIEFGVVIALAQYITDNILKINKWYVEFAIYLVLFFLLAWVKSIVKKINEKRKEAKQFKSLDQISDDILENIKNLKASGEMVKAVKMVRNTTDVSLLEAKQFVDEL